MSFVIIISESNDHFTDLVIEWLTNKVDDIIRINEEDKINNLHIDMISNNSITIKGRKIDWHTVDYIYYRRGGFSIEKTKLPNIKSEKVYSSVRYFLNWEWNVLNSFLIEQLLPKETLGNFNHTPTNKLTNLSIAKAVGLKIPNTTITNVKFSSYPYMSMGW